MLESKMLSQLGLEVIKAHDDGFVFCVYSISLSCR